MLNPNVLFFIKSKDNILGFDPFYTYKCSIGLPSKFDLVLQVNAKHPFCKMRKSDTPPFRNIIY